MQIALPRHKHNRTVTWIKGTIFHGFYFKNWECKISCILSISVNEFLKTISNIRKLRNFNIQLLFDTAHLNYVKFSRS